MFNLCLMELSGDGLLVILHLTILVLLVVNAQIQELLQDLQQQLHQQEEQQQHRLLQQQFDRRRSPLVEKCFGLECLVSTLFNR